MPKTFVSPDGKRAVTVGTDIAESFPIRKDLRHRVVSVTELGERVWQVSSREAARIIVRAYKKRGYAATYLKPV